MTVIVELSDSSGIGIEEELDGSGSGDVEPVIEGSGIGDVLVETVDFSDNATEVVVDVEQREMNSTTKLAMATFEVNCEVSQFGCCPDEMHPAHGPDYFGCCASSEFGCCADCVNEAQGPYGEGCDCQSTQFGCCPDERTPAKV